MRDGMLKHNIDKHLIAYLNDERKKKPEANKTDQPHEQLLTEYLNYPLSLMNFNAVGVTKS
jgi:hypothetical protein